MQRNKYLDDIGIPIDEYGTNFKYDKRSDELYKAQRNLYGFDERETWSLDNLFGQWLYSHLMMYLEKANEFVNLDYHMFNFKGKEYTQREAIEFIIEKVKVRLITDEYEIELNEYNRILEEYQDAIRLWAEILPAMWW